MGNTCRKKPAVAKHRQQQKAETSEAQLAGETVPLLLAEDDRGDDDDDVDEKASEPGSASSGSYGASDGKSQYGGRDGGSVARSSALGSRRGMGRREGVNRERRPEEEVGGGRGGDAGGSSSHRSFTRLLYDWIPYLFVVYLIASALIIENFLDETEFDTFLKCMYFIVVTVLTIGYGDLCPETDAGKLYVIGFIVVMSCFATVFLGFVADWALRAQERAMELINKANEAEVKRDLKALQATVADNAGKDPGEMAQAEGSLHDADDEEHFRPASPIEAIAKAFSVVFFFAAIGAVSMMCLEGMALLDGVYWAVVTITTVGYGDFSPKTEYGRIFTCFYATVGVATVAWALSGVTQSFLSEGLRAEAEEKLGSQRITPEYLVKMGGPKGYVTENDFLKAMLVALGKVTEEDLQRIEERFVQLDVNGDRTLSIEDLVGDIDNLPIEPAKPTGWGKAKKKLGVKKHNSSTKTLRQMTNF